MEHNLISTAHPNRTFCHGKTTESFISSFITTQIILWVLHEFLAVLKNSSTK